MNPVCRAPSVLNEIHMDTPARRHRLCNVGDSARELNAFTFVFKIGTAWFKMNSKTHANNLKF